LFVPVIPARDLRPLPKLSVLNPPKGPITGVAAPRFWRDTRVP